MKIIYTSKLEEILVDDEDFNYLNGWKWCVGKWGYAYRMTENGKKNGKRARKVVKLHRVIMNAQEGIFVDHKNRDKLDNRRENLRLATNQQNQRNSKVTTRNRWGYKGVSKTADPRYRSPWRMCTHEPNGRQIVLHFSTAEEAAQKYDELNENWFGDFALTNKKLGLV